MALLAALYANVELTKLCQTLIDELMCFYDTLESDKENDIDGTQFAQQICLRARDTVSVLYFPTNADDIRKKVADLDICISALSELYGAAAIPLKRTFYELCGSSV